VPYLAGKLGTAQVMTTATEDTFDENRLNLHLRDDRTVTATYFLGDALFHKEGSAQSQWGLATRVAEVPSCEKRGACELRTVFDQAGDVTIVWTQKIDGSSSMREIWFVQRSDGQWGGSAKLADEHVSGHFGVGGNPRGDVVVAYAAMVAPDLPTELRILHYTKTEGWVRQELPVAKVAAAEPSVGISPEGHAVAAWMTFTDDRFDVWSSQATGNEWTSPQRIDMQADSFDLVVGVDISMVAVSHYTTGKYSVVQLD
jgi:hypothetical protein